MTDKEVIKLIDSLLDDFRCGYVPKKHDIVRALNMAKARLADGDRVVTLEEWISSFDNEDCGALTQMEQLEIKSLLLELKYYRDKQGDKQ